MSHIHKEGGSKYSRLLYKYHITYGCLSLFFYDLLAADIGHYKVYSINHGNQRQSQKYILIDIFIILISPCIPNIAWIAATASGIRK